MPTLNIAISDGSFWPVEATLIDGGLAVHRRHRKETFTVTHVASMQNLIGAGCDFERQEDAEAAAREIVKLTDWTKDGETVRRTKGIQPKIATIAARHNGARA